MDKKIIKPWGSEELIEVNEHYVVKRLFMKKKHQCSLQYHEDKHETVFVISGELKLTIGDSIEKLDFVVLNPGDSVVLPPKKFIECMEMKTLIILRQVLLNYMM